MKNSLIALSLVAVILATPVLVLAIPGEITLDTIISSTKTIIWTVFLLLVVICFIVAGILFLTAGGAPEKISTARSSFMWGVVGIIVAIVAYSIVTIVGLAFHVGVV